MGSEMCIRDRRYVDEVCKFKLDVISCCIKGNVFSANFNDRTTICNGVKEFEFEVQVSMVSICVIISLHIFHHFMYLFFVFKHPPSSGFVNYTNRFHK